MAITDLIVGEPNPEGRPSGLVVQVSGRRITGEQRAEEAEHGPAREVLKQLERKLIAPSQSVDCWTLHPGSNTGADRGDLLTKLDRDTICSETQNGDN